MTTTKWLDVLRRIEAGESRNTEFKRGLGDLSAVGKAICAFANTEGGILVLGVDDGRTIVGVREDAERVQERLMAFIHTGCSSPVSAYMRVESVRAGAHPRSRNESLANFMLAMGFMEQRGRGWPLMRYAMREFNGTEPELVHDRQSRFVSVRFVLD